MVVADVPHPGGKQAVRLHSAPPGRGSARTAGSGPQTARADAGSSQQRAGLPACLSTTFSSVPAKRDETRWKREPQSERRARGHPPLPPAFPNPNGHNCPRGKGQSTDDLATGPNPRATPTSGSHGARGHSPAASSVSRAECRQPARGVAEDGVSPRTVPTTATYRTWQNCTLCSMPGF